MLSALRWLALEVKYLERARPVYVDRLGLPVERRDEHELVCGVGDTELVLRRPGMVPRGALHTHFAFSTPAAEYDDWWSRLSGHYDLDEHRFGSAKSLYFHDLDDHCVEIGQSGHGGRGLTGIFEVVLEVERLDRSEAFYTALGFEPVDRGQNRRRVRFTGPVDLELWEPQLGLADARGGVHVDLGFSCDEPSAIVEGVESMACSVEPTDDGFRVKDPDGHYLTVTR